MNADVVRRLADSGDPTYTALVPVAADYDEAARGVDGLPPAFWIPTDR